MFTRTISIFGTDMYHVLFWFLCYSVMGWVVESIYMSICNKKITNRGFMYGPFCPIYAFGALMVYFLLRPFSHNLVLTYLLGSITATGFEFIIGLLMQGFFGKVWWDYSKKPFNYRGVLCLESTIAWGFYTVFLFLFLQKGVVWFTEMIPYRIGLRILPVVYTVAIMDFLIHLLMAKKEHMPERVENILTSIHSIRYR